MKKTVWAIVVLAGLFISVPVFSQKNVHASPEALRGLAQVGLHVDYDGPVDTSDGLTPAQLRSEILLRLKIAGLTVLDDAQSRRGEKSGDLILHVRAIPLAERAGRPDAFCYTLSLNLFQDVMTMAEPRIRTKACTWSEGSSIVAPREELRNVTEMVGTLGLDFASTLEAANRIQEPEVDVVP